MRISRPNAPAILAIFVAAVVVVLAILLPLVKDRSFINVVNLIALATIGAIGLNLLTGVAGQASIGNAAFLAVGGFAAAILGAELGLPFLVVVPVASVAAALVGAVVGLPALRLRGFYLVISTLAFHYLIYYTAERYETARVAYGGFDMPIPSFGVWYALQTPKDWYVLLLGVAALNAVVASNLIHSRIGRSWLAIRENEMMAESVGVDLTKAKLSAFTVSSAMMGLQGALFAYYLGSVHVEVYSLEVAVQYIAMIIIGGVGTVSGAVLGAAFVVGLPFTLKELAAAIPADVPGASLLSANTFDIQVAIYGACIVLFLLYQPRGIAGGVARLLRPIRMHATPSRLMVRDAEAPR